MFTNAEMKKLGGIELPVPEKCAEGSQEATQLGPGLLWA